MIPFISNTATLLTGALAPQALGLTTSTLPEPPAGDHFIQSGGESASKKNKNKNNEPVTKVSSGDQQNAQQKLSKSQNELRPILKNLDTKLNKENLEKAEKKQEEIDKFHSEGNIPKGPGYYKSAERLTKARAAYIQQIAPVPVEIPVPNCNIEDNCNPPTPKVSPGLPPAPVEIPVPNCDIEDNCKPPAPQVSPGLPPVPDCVENNCEPPTPKVSPGLPPGPIVNPSPKTEPSALKTPDSDSSSNKVIAIALGVGLGASCLSSSFLAILAIGAGLYCSRNRTTTNSPPPQAEPQPQEVSFPHTIVDHLDQPQAAAPLPVIPACPTPPPPPIFTEIINTTYTGPAAIDVQNKAAEDGILHTHFELINQAGKFADTPEQKGDQTSRSPAVPSSIPSPSSGKKL